MVAGGWSSGEGGARWSIGPTAELIFRWREPAPLRLVIQARLGFGVPAHLDRVDVFANDMHVAHWSNDANVAKRTLVIPRAAIGSDDLVRLRLRIHGAISPGAAGLSLDERQLGVIVAAVDVE